MSWATVWRTLIRPDALETQIKTDPHSPGVYRATQPLKNVDAFYEAFGINIDPHGWGKRWYDKIGEDCQWHRWKRQGNGQVRPWHIFQDPNSFISAYTRLHQPGWAFERGVVRAQVSEVEWAFVCAAPAEYLLRYWAEKRRFPGWIKNELQQSQGFFKEDFVATRTACKGILSDSSAAWGTCRQYVP